VFCLECIRNWRATDQHDADKAIESVSHMCPLCRQLSPFVVPSPVHATGQIKVKMTAQYLKRLKQIPCKYFKYGAGYCPFSAACFYAHLNKDGSVATLEQNLLNRPRAQRRPGHLIDGQVPLTMNTRLLELILPFLSETVRSQILAYSFDDEDEELLDEDFMSRDDSSSLNYTRESDDTDSGSGSESNNFSSSSLNVHQYSSYNYPSYVYYDSDSDVPERQLYDGNNDPDGADEISVQRCSSMSEEEIAKYSNDDDSDSGLNDDSKDNSSQMSGADDSNDSTPNLESDDSGSSSGLSDAYYNSDCYSNNNNEHCEYSESADNDSDSDDYVSD